VPIIGPTGAAVFANRAGNAGMVFQHPHSQWCAPCIGQPEQTARELELRGKLRNSPFGLAR
jgi:hypothetical protein